MPRNYQYNSTRIAAIMNSLPGTLGEIHEKCGVSNAALSRWLPKLIKEEKIHYIDFRPRTHGGQLRPIYRAGPKPEGARVRYPKKTEAQRQRLRYAALHRTGEIEDHLAARRGARALARQPAIDPLIQAFYGVSR